MPCMQGHAWPAAMSCAEGLCSAIATLLRHYAVLCWAARPEPPVWDPGGLSAVPRRPSCPRSGVGERGRARACGQDQAKPDCGR